MEVTPHGATLTKKAPGISLGRPASKNIYPINNKTNGEIINFKIEIDVVSLLITLSVWKDNIIPIAKSPTGETHLARVDKVYSMGVSSILKLNTNKKTPIRIDNIIGLRIIFFTNTKN